MDRDDSDGFEAIFGLKSGGFVAIVLGCPLIFPFAGSGQSLGVRSTRSDWPVQYDQNVFVRSDYRYCCKR